MDRPYALLGDAPLASLAEHRSNGGGRGLERALGMAPAEVITEVTRSGLRGRGGAGFPTGTKWASVADGADSEVTISVVGNGAEGEPGTYKDRTLLARAPYDVIEGALIAAHAVGATGAYLATKQRFTDELARLIAARDELAADGVPGAADVRIVPGPDEYLFGEEKALLEVIEGKLPLPRILPPYQTGLFATMQRPNPTVVNNVETLAHAARILADGGSAFRATGTQDSPGTMLFTVMGDVANAGVYELPLGTSLRALLVDIAGAADILAVYSGTSNSVITPAALDLPLDFDAFTAAGTGLGSGGFVVYDGSRDIVQVTATLTRFLAIESCGQCLPCKLGTAALVEHLDRIVAGDGTADDLAEIQQATATVTDQNRCYLPVGAALLVQSTLAAYAPAFEAHLGVAADPAVAVDVPKIEALDHATGEVTLDLAYRRKRADWTYADA